MLNIGALTCADKKLSLAVTVAPLGLSSFKSFVVYGVHNHLNSCNFIVFFKDCKA